MGKRFKQKAVYNPFEKKLSYIKENLESCDVLNDFILFDTFKNFPILTVVFNQYGAKLSAGFSKWSNVVSHEKQINEFLRLQADGSEFTGPLCDTAAVTEYKGYKILEIGSGKYKQKYGKTKCQAIIDNFEPIKAFVDLCDSILIDMADSESNQETESATEYYSKMTV